MDKPGFLFEKENIYGDPEVKIISGGKDIVIISDLHLAAGLNANNNYDGTENFYADASFSRFLEYLQNAGEGKDCILIINGDFIDFLRIKEVPLLEKDFKDWENLLKGIGINKSWQELQSSIDDKEREYGLKTQGYKSVWKLDKCITGHQQVFEAIAMWLMNGNQFIITKGNHDLEWYWEAVRSYLCYRLTHLMASLRGDKATEEYSGCTENNILFVDNALIIDGKIHIAHGHLYENFTFAEGEPTLNNGTELNLPFGSFFNRYLINRLELYYPFLDNVRPAQKILPLLIRERFPLAIRVLFQYLPFTILIIPKKMYKQAFKYILTFLVIVVLPIAITIYSIWRNIKFPAAATNTSFAGKQILNFIMNFGYLFLSYIFGRVMVMFQLSSPPTFFPFAKAVVDKNQDIQLVIFGHTHNPEQQKWNNKVYINTGTWMPVYDLSMADVRMDKTYSFMLIQQDDSGKIISHNLWRWNDDAMRAELMQLRDRK
ncbi:MAG: hypothetical protein JWP81_2717 [Ferruginibacter sp.]|nr:hypothetical protein [Ferruginibacter sp.]